MANPSLDTNTAVFWCCYFNFFSSCVYAVSEELLTSSPSQSSNTWVREDNYRFNFAARET